MIKVNESRDGGVQVTVISQGAQLSADISWKEWDALIEEAVHIKKQGRRLNAI